MFVSKDDNRATGTYMWTFLEINDESIETNMWFQFEDDGTYIVYDFESDDWWWGYYYIDQAMNYIVFDADEDDPDSENASWWRIDNIENISSETGENDVTCTDKEGNTFVIGSFLNDEWEEEEPYTEAEYSEILVGKTWVMESQYSIETVYSESYSDTSITWAGDDEVLLFALDFKINNEISIYMAEISYGIINTEVTDTTDGPTVLEATYTVSSTGIITLNFGEGESSNIQIEYTGNYYGESGDDNYFGSTYSETEADGTYFEQTFFMEQSLFESEYYSIGYPITK